MQPPVTKHVLTAMAADASSWCSASRLTGGARQGVMLTHGNLMAVVAGQLMGMDKISEQTERPESPQRFTQDDVMMSYLPLAHIFDRCGNACREGVW